ncbi:MAG: hypothetical protein ACKVOJ_13935 [Sphingomonadaceae bacterium]
MVAVAWLVIARGDVIAPLFVSEKRCGPLETIVQRVRQRGDNRSDSFEKLSYPIPIDSGDFVSSYRSAVATHVVKILTADLVQHSGVDSEPFRLSILFVDTASRINIGNSYDDSFSRIKLSSPWVRVAKSDWSPCYMKVIFFHGWRQIMRDQYELLKLRKVAWTGPDVYTDKEMDQYRRFWIDNYPRTIVDQLPKDILIRFLNSKQGEIGSWGPDPRIEKATLVAYTELSKKMIDLYFERKIEKEQTYSDINQIKLRSSYKYDSIIFDVEPDNLGYGDTCNNPQTILAIPAS